MEEIKNKKFKFTELYYQFPKMIQVIMINAPFSSNMQLYESPFGNCQTFTIGNAFKLKRYNKEEVIELFKLIYDKFGRQQVLVDLKEEHNEETLKAIEHIIINKYSTPYVSTNGSHMNLNLIQLKTSLLSNE